MLYETTIATNEGHASPFASYDVVSFAAASPDHGSAPMWAPLRRISQHLAQQRIRQTEQRFFQRFSGRSLIVHAGLDVEWLEALLKVGGGGSHFRVDTRHLPARRPTPVEWAVRRFILPLGLPEPMVVIVHDHALTVRHLRRGRHILDPAEIPSVVDDMKQRSRAHASIDCRDGRITVSRGMNIDDNDYGDYGLAD
ncbi:MAG: hypothetical protein ACYCQK_08560 [Acidiferrobacteraceae bacterium]